MTESKLSMSFFHSMPKEFLILGIFVNDGLIASSNSKLATDLLSALKLEFEMVIGELNVFLGMQIVQTPTGSIFVNQHRYIKTLIDLYGMSGAIPVKTPMESGEHLVVHTGDRLDVPYQQLVGALLYLVVSTRPDIAFAVNRLAQFTQNPGPAHWTALKRILRYLKSTAQCGLLFQPRDSDLTNLEIYSDADWATCTVDRKSQLGFLVKLGSNILSWDSRKQMSVSLSTSEAKFVMASIALQESIWFKRLLTELITTKRLGCTLYCANQS